MDVALHSFNQFLNCIEDSYCDAGRHSSRLYAECFTKRHPFTACVSLPQRTITAGLCKRLTRYFAQFFVNSLWIKFSQLEECWNQLFSQIRPNGFGSIGRIEGARHW